MAYFVFVAVFGFLFSIVLAGYWVKGAVKTRSIHSGHRYGRFALICLVVAFLAAVLTPEPDHMKAANSAFSSRDWQTAIGEARSVPTSSRRHGEAQVLVSRSLDSLASDKLLSAGKQIAIGKLVEAVALIKGTEIPARLAFQRDSLLAKAKTMALDNAGQAIKEEKYQAALDVLNLVPPDDRDAQARVQSLRTQATKGLQRLAQAEMERQRQADTRILQRGKGFCAKKQWDSALAVLGPLVDTITRKPSSAVTSGPCYKEAKRYWDIASGSLTEPARRQLAADLAREFLSKGYRFDVWVSGEYAYTLNIRHQDIDDEFAQQYLDGQASLKMMYRRIILSNGYDKWTWDR